MVGHLGVEPSESPAPSSAADRSDAGAVPNEPIERLGDLRARFDAALA